MVHVFYFSNTYLRSMSIFGNLHIKKNAGQWGAMIWNVRVILPVRLRFAKIEIAGALN